MPAMPSATLTLASRSPRRAQLLREAGYAFEQCDPAFDDPPIPAIHHGQSPADKAVELATRKALSVDATACGIAPHTVLLAADTLCIAADGSLAGTPTTVDAARTMIESFVNTSHQVITAVALYPLYSPTPSPERSEGPDPRAFADTARVTFEHVSRAQIDAYLDTGQWRGKAGGYNLFDRQRDGWPIRVHGDPTTVVGLPMVRLTRELAALGVHPTR